MVYPRALFDWTKVIQNPELKVAVDFALCSVCRHYPDILTSLLATFVDLLENSTRASSTSIGTVLECQSVMETLARAAQSEPALEKLVHSGLLDLVSEAITGNLFDSVFRCCLHLIICGFLFLYCRILSGRFELGRRTGRRRSVEPDGTTSRRSAGILDAAVRGMGIGSQS